MSKLINELNGKNFKEFINGSKIPVLVDFWAAWCGPCRMLAPELEKLAEELEGKLAVAKVNVDESEELAVEYDITGIPAMHLFVGGKIKEKIVGYKNKAALLEAISKYL